MEESEARGEKEREVAPPPPPLPATTTPTPASQWGRTRAGRGFSTEAMLRTRAEEHACSRGTHSLGWPAACHHRFVRAARKGARRVWHQLQHERQNAEKANARGDVEDKEDFSVEPSGFLICCLPFDRLAEAVFACFIGGDPWLSPAQRRVAAEPWEDPSGASWASDPSASSLSFPPRPVWGKMESHLTFSEVREHLWAYREYMRLQQEQAIAEAAYVRWSEGLRSHALVALQQEESDLAQQLVAEEKKKLHQRAAYFEAQRRKIAVWKEAQQQQPHNKQKKEKPSPPIAHHGHPSFTAEHEARAVAGAKGTPRDHHREGTARSGGAVRGHDAKGRMGDSSAEEGGGGRRKCAHEEQTTATHSVSASPATAADALDRTTTTTAGVPVPPPAAALLGCGRRSGSASHAAASPVRLCRGQKEAIDAGRERFRRVQLAKQKEAAQKKSAVLDRAWERWRKRTHHDQEEHPWEKRDGMCEKAPDGIDRKKSGGEQEKWGGKVSARGEKEERGGGGNRVRASTSTAGAGGDGGTFSASSFPRFALPTSSSLQRWVLTEYPEMAEETVQLLTSRH